MARPDIKSEYFIDPNTGQRYIKVVPESFDADGNLVTGSSGNPVVNVAAEIVSYIAAFAEDEYLEVEIPLTFGQTLSVTGISGWNSAIISASDLTGDTTTFSIKGVINNHATQLIAGYPANGGADVNAFGTLGYHIKLGYPSLQFIANGTSGGLNVNIVYKKIGFSAMGPQT